MDTKKVNSIQSGDKKRSNGNASMKTAFAGVAGMVTGGMAGAMGDDIVTLDVEPQPIKPTEPINPTPVAEPAPEESTNPEPTPVSSEEPIVESVVEPTPIVESDLHHEEVEDQPMQNEESVQNEEPVETEEQTSMEEEVIMEEDVNEIADVIVSGEQIDPNDIDMEEVINFDEIGTVYTVTGESHTAASFHGEDGSELLMVDVDADGIFDVITTPEGELLAETTGDLNVSDAEVMINDEPVYLAQNEFEQQDSTIIEDIVDDIIQS